VQAAGAKNRLVHGRFCNTCRRTAVVRRSRMAAEGESWGGGGGQAEIAARQEHRSQQRKPEPELGWHGGLFLCCKPLVYASPMRPCLMPFLGKLSRVLPPPLHLLPRGDEKSSICGVFSCPSNRW
jgi:hypothetical protein